MAEVTACATLKYQTSLTLIFNTEDVRYEWLTKVVAVMEGDFDEKTGRATIGERGLAIFLRMRSCMPQSTPFVIMHWQDRHRRALQSKKATVSLSRRV